ncbi:plasmid stabilization protein StbA [Citrobacter freundii]|uniref:plasmid stabilization protein StbA n=1 Tax=Klebsiella pneumoniae TaxID=573 RepID=UPI000E2DC908|nr:MULTISPECIES: plasmid stabilization protein StbA [Enterobacteriaceae]EFA9853247.1 StbA [Salmonella enterica]EKN3834264.1 StbA [Yersinia enterocolitica]EMB5593720.1 StbA [Klebsiella pneumoniae]KAB8006207.1 StbA [Klebsiella pneumoniae]KAB8016834.1 StbA [Klebsiella pneumoniae]
MKPKSIRAAIQMMLPEVEEMLSLGVSREEVFKAVSERFSLENVNVRSFDTALYRARQNRAKHAAPDSVLHNTESAGASEQKKAVLHNTEKPAQSEQAKKDVLHNTQDATEGDKKKQSPGIIGKEFFDEAKAEFDPNEFIKKY